MYDCKVKVGKRLDRFDSIYVPMQFELWYLNPDKLVEVDNYIFLSKRTVNILLRSDRSTHAHRPILFEYFSFAAFTITAHACITSYEIVKKKPTPDPPISEKFRLAHFGICRKLISSTSSLHRFIQRYGSLVTSPLKMGKLDIYVEEMKLKKELEASEKGDADPYLVIEDQYTSLCIRLKRVFTQLYQLFDNSRELSQILLHEFDHMRMKHFSESFAFIEDNVQTLLRPLPNQNNSFFDLLKRDPYFSYAPRLPIYVEESDVKIELMTAIVEQRFLSMSLSPNKKKELLTVIEPADSRNSSNYDNLRMLKGEKLNDEELELCIFEVEPYQFKRRMSDPQMKIGVQLPVMGAFLGGNLIDISNPNRRLLDDHITDLSYQNKSHSMCEIQKNTDNLSTSEMSSQSSSSCGFVNEEKEEKEVQKSTGCSPLIPMINKNRHKKNRFSIDSEIVNFAQRKEHFKKGLRRINFPGYLYSDSAHIDHFVFFANATKKAIENRDSKEVHLVVFVHGLEGTSEDLSTYRNFLRLALPDCNFSFLLSEVNQTETWSDLMKMADNLLDELLTFIDGMPKPPDRISMVAHSLGGVIVRTMCGLKGAEPLVPKLHTLLTLNSPHCGLLYNQRAASWGISILKWWKQSACLEQLTLRDTLNLRKTFLYRLSQNRSLGLFKNVLLVGSYDDTYVPGHSALIETCKLVKNDTSLQGLIYMEMLSNLAETIASSPRHTTLVKYTVSHALANVPRVQQVTGRAVHIAAVDDDIFIEKLITVSASRYFR